MGLFTSVIFLWEKRGVFSGDGVVPALVEGVAPQKALQRQKAALGRAIFLDRFESVLRAGGDIAAAGGKEGRNGPLIKADHAQKDLLHASVNSPSSPRQRR